MTQLPRFGQSSQYAQYLFFGKKLLARTRLEKFFISNLQFFIFGKKSPFFPEIFQKNQIYCKSYSKFDFFWKISGKKVIFGQILKIVNFEIKNFLGVCAPNVFIPKKKRIAHIDSIDRIWEDGQSLSWLYLDF